MSKNARLSDAQLTTLRRVRDGIRYEMTGDGKHGREVRYRIGSREDVQCKSLAPLLRAGLIEFKSASVCGNHSYYEVVCTVDGYNKLEDW